MTKQEKQQTEREEYKITLEEYRIHTERIKALDDRILSNSQIVDRSVLYLSAVGIGFIIKTPDMLTINTCAIRLILILFTLAILTTLASFPTSDINLRQKIKRIEAEKTNPTEEENDPYNKDLLSKTVSWLSHFSIGFFAIAIIILLFTLL